MNSMGNFSFKKTFIILIIVCSLIILIDLTYLNVANILQSVISGSFLEEDQDVILMYGNLTENSIKIAVTSCGHQILKQTLVMLKSAVIFTQCKLHFIIISDAKHKLFKRILEWPKTYLDKISFQIVSPSFPNVSNPYYWKYSFAPCSAQRLFYPLILPHHDSLLHIDSDIVFLTPPELLWSFFSQMNSSQIASMATEDINANTTWYRNYKTAPYFAPFGLNSGVMLMNLTRMRQRNFHEEMQSIVKTWFGLLPWFDQDVFNVYFNHHPTRVFELPCRFNYLTDHCKNGRLCISAEEDGVAILHGSRHVFTRDTEKSFKAVYETIRDYPMENDLDIKLSIALKEKLEKISDSVCSNASHLFVKTLKETISKISVDS